MNIGVIGLGVVGSAISAYFYLKVIMVMYMKEPNENTTLSTDKPAIIALTITAIAVIFLGIYPAPVIEFTNQAATGFIP